MRNIAFAKIGKSIKLKSAYSPIGGDNEAPQLLRLLANNNPHLTFHIVGRSDFDRLTTNEKLKLFPYNNVVDAFKGHRGPANEDHVIDYWNKFGCKPDACIFMMGQIGTVTIPNRIEQVKNRSLTAAVIEMTKNYSTPITKWWNENLDVTVVEIINDPRYDSSQARDMMHNPTISLSQYNYNYEKNSIKSYEDQDRIIRNIPVTYCEMERIFQYDREVPPIDIQNRTIDFMIVLNEGTPSRYNLLKEWVLDYNADVEIYGKWSDDIMKDERFKGSLSLDILQEKLRKVKSTFIIPIANGWATSKYIEMIHAGVVPILHPSYDTQNNTNLPNELRPKNPKQAIRLIEALQDDDIYNGIIKKLRNQYCTKEYYDGSRLNKEIMTAINNDYVPVNLDEYEHFEKEPEGLEAFF